MMDLVCHLEQMYSMWDYELNEAIKKGDTGNIMYCKQSMKHIIIY